MGGRRAHLGRRQRLTERATLLVLTHPLGPSVGHLREHLHGRRADRLRAPGRVRRAARGRDVGASNRCVEVVEAVQAVQDSPR